MFDVIEPVEEPKHGACQLVMPQNQTAKMYGCVLISQFTTSRNMKTVPNDDADSELHHGFLDLNSQKLTSFFTHF